MGNWKPGEIHIQQHTGPILCIFWTAIQLSVRGIITDLVTIKLTGLAYSSHLLKIPQTENILTP